MPKGIDERISKAWELAHYYVNETPGNKTASMRKYKQAHGEDINEGTIRYLAYQAFQNPEVQLHIDELRAENRKHYADIRDKNIANLCEIAFDDKTNNKDRIAATKELNSMFGYNSQNINMSGNQTLEIVIE